MKMQYWRIEGYDSDRRIYKKYLPVGCLTEPQLISALQCLVAKEGLNNDEILGAYVKKRTKLSNRLLDVHKGMQREFHCGNNPYFCAVIVQETDANS